MPSPRTEEQRLLVQNVGESPATRLLLISIAGGEPEKLAAISQRLSAALAAHAEFGLVANGQQAPLAIPEQLLPYRYLITDSFDAHPLDAARLKAELDDRVADMASPAAGFLEEWLPRDPTLELLHLASRWQPRVEPHRLNDVWFTADGKRALLLAETRASAFDPDGQTVALEALRKEFESASAGTQAKLVVSGSGYFSSIIKNRTQTEATWFGGAATVGMILLMWLAYRNFSFTLLGALPLVIGGAGRPGRGERAVRQRARHHAGLRLHADRSRAGLSHPSVQPPRAAAARGGHRASRLAAAGHRRRQHLHRLPGVPDVRGDRAGAAGQPHRDGIAGGGPDDALPAAAHRGADTARSRQLGIAGSYQCHASSGCRGHSRCWRSFRSRRWPCSCCAPMVSGRTICPSSRPCHRTS